MNTKSFLIILLAAGLAFAEVENEKYSDEKNVAKTEEKQPQKPVAKATDKLPWPNLSSLWYDYKARHAIQDKNTEIAMEYELKILENEPNSVQTHSNLGIIFDYLQKKDESGQSFDNALELLERYKDQLYPTDVFQIYYNLGLRFHNAKETEKALEYYQKALEINPASMETKHNIELLIQQQQGGGGGGQGDNKNKDQQGKPDQDPKEGDDKDKKDKDQNQDRQQTSKYKPRPYQGDKLSEADVKKILGELSQQDKKIRANYNKKDRKEDKNAKDW
ncbi:MAG: tetratricopeptide repeat protein [Pseudobdellovibrio sp.]|nr:tetratricopeptide repeat protein [Pseudobdellovibrio sp.]